MKKKIGLFFGTFNPMHIGHLIIANHFAEFSDADEIWLIITPHNPFKKKKTLLEDYHRYEMVYRAVEKYEKLKPSKVEFDLPQPNYTVNTLVNLEEKYPDYEFALIMGEDNLKNFHKWKNSEVILEKNELLVYPRLGNQGKTQLENKGKVTMVEAPMMEISSTFIRDCIKNGKNVQPLLPQPVWHYIDEMNFYR